MSGVHLTPDEHVLGGERDQFVALLHVGTNRVHDPGFGHINLRIQIGNTELAPATAAGSHLDDAKRRPLVGKQDVVAGRRMYEIDVPR